MAIMLYVHESQTVYNVVQTDTKGLAQLTKQGLSHLNPPSSSGFGIFDDCNK